MIKEDLAHFFRIYKIKNKISTINVIKYSFHPRFSCVAIYRASKYFHLKKMRILSRLLQLLNSIIYGVEISMDTDIAGGLFIPHTYGIVIGASKIGKNSVIYQGVTLGAKELDVPFNHSSRPTIGDNVIIASGAKVIGGISIGNNVTIAANSVVLHSCEDHCVIGGMPARILKVKDVVV
ncbi:MAG: DapH/DapD/GlmU-related protein [Citrobacter sp.]|uniref:serine O-acetyltransferase n=1 Tax=Citrobacter sp. TaxID=1896336 RepID=UPI002FCAFF20